MPKPSAQLSPRSETGTSFPNHELPIVLALVLVGLLVGVPLWKTHGGKGCLLALLLVAGGIAALIATFALGVWVAQNMDRAGCSAMDRLWRSVGHALRFAMGGLLGMLLAAPVLVPKHLGPFRENLGLGVGIAFLGTLSAWSYLRVGPARYVRLGKVFLGTLLASWFLGLLSLLLPWAWALDVAILTPPVLFAAWVIRKCGILADPGCGPRDSGADTPGGR